MLAAGDSDTVTSVSLVGHPGTGSPDTTQSPGSLSCSHGYCPTAEGEGEGGGEGINILFSVYFSLLFFNQTLFKTHSITICRVITIKEETFLA